MSIENAREQAFAELRDLLAEGMEPYKAIKQASLISGLREDVVSKIGERLIQEQPKLVQAKQLRMARIDKRQRFDEILRRYNYLLESEPNATVDAIEKEISIQDFTEDEVSDLFLKTLDAWLTRNIRD